ncbi:hypothetical protein ACFQO9_16115 [Chryseobacterium zhengzhouense]|uniref:DUF4258 domain-containing protein n=1 Tax=Chryseobacterium zhengzhouense TaxID=1636086 RepID=A0ABW2M412_9FLAO
MKKIKFFLIGLVPGLIIVFFVLNKKGVSCSGYLPNSRVIAETLSKDFTYSDDFKVEMAHLKLNEKFLKDSIITSGKIDFDRSHAQKKPCPDYVLTYPEKNPVYEITFEKCDEKAVLNSLKKLK